MRRAVFTGFGVSALAVLGVADVARHMRVVHGQSACINGLCNQNVTLPAANVVGVLPLYNFDGTTITGAKCAQGSVLSDSTGSWTVDYSALAFKTAITRMDVSAASPTNGNITTLTGMYSTSYSQPTLTSVSGRVSVPTAVAVGGFATAFATTATKVFVSVCGS